MGTLTTEMQRPTDSRRVVSFRLFIISFASLFWEVFLIRWLPSEVPFVSYFRSLVLLAAFFGMGLGCLLKERVRGRDATLVCVFLGGLCVLFAIIALAGNDLRARGFGKASGILDQGSYTDRVLVPDFTMEFEGSKGGGNAVVIGAFICVSALFLPIGGLIARSFDLLPSVLAYLVNIGGALLGTLAFVLISFARVGPPVWCVIGLGSLLLLLLPPRLGAPDWKRGLLGGVLSASALALITIPNLKDNLIWSPYQRVSWYAQTLRVKMPDGSAQDRVLRIPIFVNYEYHQQIVNLALFRGPDDILQVMKQTGEQDSTDSLGGFSARYDHPYMRKPGPQAVLILAAGNGNEAAAALRHGAKEIDAVEIDPGIIDVGRRCHPEAPYASPKVRVISDDARAFLQRSDKKYDLIIMNAVDSHSQFATSAGLRLDSYIFTLEFFEQVRRHMKEDGLYALEFSGFHWVDVPWARERLSEILWRVFAFRSDGQNTSIGAGGPQFFIPLRPRPAPETHDPSILISTDDWPHFYLRQASIPRAYLRIIGVVVGMSLLAVLLAQRPGGVGFDAHFFLLGAAFMLLEIKSISELSLAFGATWFVNSVAISAILLAIGIASLLVLRLGAVPYLLGYGIVLVALALNLFAGAAVSLSWSFPARVLLTCTQVAVPVFGAALVFATSFRRAYLPSAALGWNLFGAIVGGLGEYLSMVTGVRWLGVFILSLYALSWLALPRSRLRPASAPVGG